MRTVNLRAWCGDDSFNWKWTINSELHPDDTKELLKAIVQKWDDDEGGPRMMSVVKCRRCNVTLVFEWEREKGFCVACLRKGAQP